MVSKGGAVLRALPIHQSTNPGIDVIFWLRFVVGFILLLPEVLLWVLLFALKTNIGMEDEEPLCGFATS